MSIGTVSGQMQCLDYKGKGYNNSNILFYVAASIYYINILLKCFVKTNAYISKPGYSDMRCSINISEYGSAYICFNVKHTSLFDKIENNNQNICIVFI
jgi:hypothetical protein